MKKLVLILLAVGWCSFAFSQVSEVILKELQQDNQCTKLDFSMEILDLINTDVNLDGVEKRLKGDFQQAKLLIIEKKINMDKVISAFLNEGFKIYPMEEQKENMQLVYLKNGKKVSEAHMLIDGEDESLIFSLYVNVEVSDKH